jgi:hypothetical protein
MAVRRETVRKQFQDAVQPVLEPGEQLVAGAYCASGPNPLLLTGLFGLIGMLVAGVRYYFVWVTDRRVVVMGASMMTARPKGNLVWADPRGSVSISDVTPAATWSWFRYKRPGVDKPIRLNFARPWREDFAQMTAALSGGATAAPSAPSAPGAPAPPPPPQSSAPPSPPAPPMS